ncbi:MAG: quinone-dependent dihydroorotate dehydrogenase, partial [Verrucomicrobiota bacterium]
MFPYSLAKAVLFQLDPERAHHWTINGMNALQQLGMLSRVAGGDPEKATPRTVMGLKFPNAVGLAAGMDKSGIAVDAFGAIG